MKTFIAEHDIPTIAPGCSRAVGAESQPLERAMFALFNPLPIRKHAINNGDSPMALPNDTQPPPNDAAPNALTDEERAICEQLGIDPKEFAEAKAKAKAEDASKSGDKPSKAAKEPPPPQLNTERRYQQSDSLSAVELDVCAKTGLDPSAFAAFKQANL